VYEGKEANEVLIEFMKLLFGMSLLTICVIGIFEVISGMFYINRPLVLPKSPKATAGGQPTPRRENTEL
jgi:hypothetical protein